MSLLLVIPVSASDSHLIPSFIASLKRCGGIKQHNCLVVATRSASDQAQKIVDVMQELSNGAKLLTLETDPHGGWPLACNIHFHDTVEFLARTNNEQVWYWLEIDSTPLKQGWADELEREYLREKKPYMGALAPTWKVRNPGTPAEQKFQEGDHMVGTGIYPANHHHRGIFWRHANTGMPFDIANQYEVTNAGLHATKLIQHQWNTVNFRRDDGGNIVCDDKDSAGTQHGISYKGPLSPDAVVHHGCKDGSLELVLSGVVPVVATIPQPVVATVDQPQTETISTAQVVTATVEPVATDAPKEDLATRIKARIKKASIRCADIAKEEGKTVQDMKHWLEGNGFTVAKPGWIRTK